MRASRIPFPILLLWLLAWLFAAVPWLAAEAPATRPDADREGRSTVLSGPALSWWDSGIRFQAASDPKRPKTDLIEGFDSERSPMRATGPGAGRRCWGPIRAAPARRASSRARRTRPTIATPSCATPRTGRTSGAASVSRCIAARRATAEAVPRSPAPARSSRALGSRPARPRPLVRPMAAWTRCSRRRRARPACSTAWRTRSTARGRSGPAAATCSIAVPTCRSCGRRSTKRARGRSSTSKTGVWAGASRPGPRSSTTRASSAAAAERSHARVKRGSRSASGAALPRESARRYPGAIVTCARRSPRAASTATATRSCGARRTTTATAWIGR
jgi:hypothetical protein